MDALSPPPLTAMVAIGVIAFTILLLLVSFFCFCSCCLEKRRARASADPFMFSVCHTEASENVPFHWADHPTLVSELVEHGWAKYAFTYAGSDVNIPPFRHIMCPLSKADVDGHDNSAASMAAFPELSLDLTHSACDPLQKIRFNPRLPSSSSIAQSLQSALPLPGPPLGSLSFPQEAYFEISIVADDFNAQHGVRHSLTTGKSSARLIGGGRVCPWQAMATEKHPGRLDNLPTDVEIGMDLQLAEGLMPPQPDSENLPILAVGLAGGAAPPSEFPGSYLGSVGFHSTGHIYINGALHISEASKMVASECSWGAVATTIGCSFDPAAKRVRFTHNGVHICELTTKDEQFGIPLYPTVASNYDVTISVNFGQSPFEYALANVERVPDPCFNRSKAKSLKKKSTSEDSGDLFSMAHLDSQWLRDSDSHSPRELRTHRPIYSEAESDLFEIMLDNR